MHPRLDAAVLCKECRNAFHLYGPCQKNALLQRTENMFYFYEKILELLPGEVGIFVQKKIELTLHMARYYI